MNCDNAKTKNGNPDWLLRVNKPPLNLTIGDRAAISDNDFWRIVYQILDVHDVRLKNSNSGMPVDLVGSKKELKKINERCTSLQFQRFRPNTT